MTITDVRPPKPKKQNIELPDGIPLYGSCPSGEYWALYESVARVYFEDRGYRSVISFQILNEDKSEPICDSEGDPHFAVIVCNHTKTESPKSVLFKVRKAMLFADEFDPIDNASHVPGWEHFKNKRENSERRFLKIRVEKLTGPNGHLVSLVREIRQPRNDEWFTVKQMFGGLPFALPFWLNRDGTVKSFKIAEYEKFHHNDQYAINNWLRLETEDFCELAPDEVAALEDWERNKYDLKKFKFEFEKFLRETK